MTNRELIDEILTLVRSESNNNPPPLNCKIIRNYPDNPNLVDVKLEEGEVIQFVSVIGSNRIGNKAVLVFIDGASDNMLVISPSEIDDELSNISENAVENKVITTELDSKVSTSELIDLIYPIGAIYISANAVSPSILFGGEWEQIEDTFLLSSGSTYELGATGGSADAVVVKHNHTQNPHNHTQNSHSHTPASGRNFLTAPVGSTWTELQGANISGSGYHYIATSKTSNYDVAVQGSGSTTATNQQQTATNKESGEDGTGKNMPPYLVVNMWIRVN